MMKEVIKMNREAVLVALNAGKFDGISHMYEPKKHGNISYQTSMTVLGDTIEVTKTSFGKSFNGKENERFEESNTEYLTGSEATKFIEKRPYYFAQRRPELF